MKVQLVSDLHLELLDDRELKKIKSMIKPSAPVLIMAGDICACGSNSDFKRLTDFLDIYCKQFQTILHVSGNHEYYVESKSPNIIEQNTMDQIDRRLKNLTRTYKNYHYLNNDTFEYTDGAKTYVFVGATLWTYAPRFFTPKDSEKLDIHMLIENGMNDYGHIYVRSRDQSLRHKYRQYTVCDMQKKHKTALAFIKQSMKAFAKKTCILITHHKPVYDKGINLSDPYTYAYQSDLADQIIKKPFILAVYGHTHVHYDKRINGIRVVSNPKGYSGQVTNFNNAIAISTT